MYVQLYNCSEHISQSHDYFLEVKLSINMPMYVNLRHTALVIYALWTW